MHMGYRWRAPKKNNDKAWKMIAEGQYLWDAKALAKKPESYLSDAWRERQIWLMRLRNKKYRVGLTGRP